ncbi:hypothetical protein FXB66_04375 [Aggregatibacter actinomycetemcomitans]|nr:hypothetical protein FXB75_00115 [Aggregatibacter actinomycetemcomitans]TYB08103.1 hypothetical protein FXB90_00115 [Aggregatibacter actinomycetemcomitans]TYB27481.1 hypothetical protein FXB66_04375 [Aggregatibacter actinomycetemcomitans]
MRLIFTALKNHINIKSISLENVTRFTKIYILFSFYGCKTPNKMRKRNKLGRMLNQAGISGTKPMKTRVQEKTASFFIEE